MTLTNSFQELLAEKAKEKYREIMERRETLLAAWIAETGLLPSESVLCEQEGFIEDGGIVTRVWVEKKK